MSSETLKTSVHSFRITHSQAQLLKQLPQSVSASALVRAVLSMYFDGVELPSEIRAQRVRFLAQKVVAKLKKIA